MMPEEVDKTLEKKPEAVSPINPLGPLDLSETEEPKPDLEDLEHELYKEHKKLYDDIRKNIVRLLGMRNDYLLEDLEGLNISQLNALTCGYKLAQVKNPTWIALFEKFGKRFGSIIDKLIKTDLHLTEISDLTPLNNRLFAIFIFSLTF